MERFSIEAVARLWRYYQVGVINTLFGYGMFAVLIAVGLNIFVAQIVAHVLGVTFNYFSYSRHVFQDAALSKRRFLLSYTFNYFTGLACLAAATRVFASPYVAGLVAMLFSSLINYLVLRNLVFTRPAA